MPHPSSLPPVFGETLAMSFAAGLVGASVFAILVLAGLWLMRRSRRGA